MISIYIKNYFEKTIILFLFLNVIFYSQTVDKNVIVKVLTFNILHGATMQNDFNLDKIAKVINEIDPDLVALQEVDFLTNRVGKIDLTLEIAFLTKMIPLFGRAMYYDDGEYGEAILSKTTIINSTNIQLPFLEGFEPRAALMITTVLHSNDTICFVATHLDHTNDDINRVLQVEMINKVFVNNNYPTILAGDLNDSPESRTISVLEKVWTPSHNKLNYEFTYPSSEPNEKLDYIMFKPSANWEVIMTDVIKDMKASDHFAYYAILGLIK